MQTLLCDLNSITNDGNYVWTQEDKYALESQLVLHTSPPLCLDPRPLVSLVKHKLLEHKNKLNDRRLKRAMRRYSLVNTNTNRQRLAHSRLPFPFQILKIRKKQQQQQQSIIENNSNSILSDSSLSTFKMPLAAKIHLKQSFLHLKSSSTSQQRILQVRIFLYLSP